MFMKIGRKVLVAACLKACALVTSCSSTSVQMCDSEFLAKPEMQMNHRAHDLAIDDHIYFSKEAASGGRGFGSGGCGCN